MTNSRWTMPAAVAALVVPALSPSAATAAPGAEAHVADELHCYTDALTAEEVEAGETSQVDCYPIPQPASTLGGHQPTSFVLARHYSAAGGGGAVLTVNGTSCTGASVSFGAGDPWNNRIRSTRNQACGNSKHFVNSNHTGDHQLVSGFAVTNLNATLAGRVSSIEYAP